MSQCLNDGIGQGRRQREGHHSQAHRSDAGRRLTTQVESQEGFLPAFPGYSIGNPGGKAGATRRGGNSLPTSGSPLLKPAADAARPLEGIEPWRRRGSGRLDASGRRRTSFRRREASREGGEAGQKGAFIPRPVLFQPFGSLVHSTTTVPRSSKGPQCHRTASRTQTRKVNPRRPSASLSRTDFHSRPSSTLSDRASRPSGNGRPPRGLHKASGTGLGNVGMPA